jgi:putative protease
MSASYAPEILAPVGDWNMLRAAIHNGADAVYIGMPGFNARGRAPTLELSELEAMIQYAHLYGVRVLLAFNILIFERELSDVVDAVRQVLPLNPDAFIVQDIGLVRLLRTIAPDQAVHASTQMTVTNSEAIRLTHDLGIRRYVLGREVSIAEMARIKQETDKELEAFVHGALCVSYSGQCLTSESLGGRSANRGQCAQSCRLAYDLIVDGSKQEMGARSHLVSPQDLCGLEDVPRLMDAGIDSFKIEGRLKSPAYVASTARAYKQKSLGALDERGTKRAISSMERIYSRGFFNGWFNGVDHQQLVNPSISSHHGLMLGRILVHETRSILIDSTEHLRAGEGVVFRDPLTGHECGAVIFSAETDRGRLRLSFAREFDSQLALLGVGTEVYLNSSPHLEREYERSFNDKAALKKIPIRLHVRGAIGALLEVEARDDVGNVVTARSAASLQEAKSAPITVESIENELGALGGTVFRLESLECELHGSCFLNQKELKEIRREFSEELKSARTKRKVPEILDRQAVCDWIASASNRLKKTGELVEHATLPELNLLVRDIDQLKALPGLPVNTVYLDFEFGKEYGPAVEQVRALGFQAGIATTRILKPGELAHLKVIERLRPDRVLVRNLGALEYLRGSGLELHGDFSLNVTNSLSAEWFFEKGLARVCPSYDLNGEQLLELLDATTAARMEITIHHYIPAFHMEHCVFAAFLSKGSSYRDCGRPCEKHRVELRDPHGVLHPLKADAECRNTMFNGTAQTAIKLFPELLKRKVSAFRIEALFDTPGMIQSKVRVYADMLAGKVVQGDARQVLGAVERCGVTDGQLYSIRAYTDRKKEFIPREALGSVADPALKN